MHIVARVFTGIVTFVIAFLFIYLGSLSIGGAIAGACASDGSATDFQSGYEIGRKAGAKFSRNYGGIILLASLGLSAAAAVTLPLSGLVPWCNRSTPSIPPIPGQKKFRIAKDGKDVGELSVPQIKKMLLNGELTLSDYYLDPSRNKWISLAENTDLSS